jgi:hypothetical protein
MSRMAQFIVRQQASLVGIFASNLARAMRPLAATATGIERKVIDAKEFNR